MYHNKYFIPTKAMSRSSLSDLVHLPIVKTPNDGRHPWDKNIVVRKHFSVIWNSTSRSMP